MNLAVEKLAEAERLTLLNGAVGLRPPALVGAVDRAGQLHFAPFSFITVACVDPLTILFCVNNAGDPAGNRVLQAIATTGEFVINFVTEEAMATLPDLTLSAQNEAPDFDWSMVTMSSETLRVPRLIDVEIVFECRLHQIMKMGIGPGGTSVIYGDVKHIYTCDRE